MNLKTLEMPQKEAEEAFREYRRAIRSAKTAQVNSEDAQIARCYKALADGHQVLDLNDVMRRGGENTKGLPRLAISRADHESCLMYRGWTTGNVSMGPVTIGDWERRRYEYRGKVFSFTHFSIREPSYTTPTRDRKSRVAVVEFAAIVPNIPPALRPPHQLCNYHLLWEAKWEPSSPPAPKDPALLKHLGGPLYAVLATWDLTPVEQAVLGVTRN